MVDSATHVGPDAGGRGAEVSPDGLGPPRKVARGVLLMLARFA